MRVTVGELAAIVRQWAIDEPVIQQRSFLVAASNEPTRLTAILTLLLSCRLFLATLTL